MIIIKYCKNGTPISDFYISEWIELIKLDIKHNITRTYEISSSIPIYALRLEIVKGNIDYNEILFNFNDENYKADKFGIIEDQEKFLSLISDICFNIIKEQFKIRIVENKNEKYV